MYTINHREYRHIDPSPPCSEQNRLFDLTWLTVLSVVGERAFEFLQGQMTCDVRGVDAQHMKRGAFCNLKGRILALADVLSWQGCHLVLPMDLLDETLQSLSKTAAVSRVRLQRSPEYLIFGLQVLNRNVPLPGNLVIPENIFDCTADETSCLYAIDADLYLLVAESTRAQSIRAAFAAQGALAGGAEWHQLQLLQQHSEIYPATRGQFLPHRLNLHLSSCISFDKGCYKGQEIIARMHYRAKLKHMLKTVLVNSTEAVSPGMKIFDLSGQSELGELLDFCPSTEGNHLLLVSIVIGHPMEVRFEEHSESVTLTPVSDYG